MGPNPKNRDVRLSNPEAAGKAAENTHSASRRIGTSASGLVQNAFKAPSAGAVAGTLASLNSEASKGASSSASGCSSEAPPSLQSSRGVQETAGTSSTAESFRSGQGIGAANARIAQSAFDEFAEGPHEPNVVRDALQAVPSLGEDPGESSKKGDSKPSGKSASTKSNASIYKVLASIDREIRAKSELSKDFNEQIQDGAGVVALLSDPTFSVDEDPVDAWDYDYSGPDSNLVLEKAHGQPHDFMIRTAQAAANPLDLLPDFDCSLSHTTTLPRRDKGGTFSPVGDIQPWIDILNRYHDGVWGDMLPLVKEAREEIRIASASNDGALRDRPAVRRLGMLLGHLGIPVP